MLDSQKVFTTTEITETQSSKLFSDVYCMYPMDASVLGCGLEVCLWALAASILLLWEVR